MKHIGTLVADIQEVLKGGLVPKGAAGEFGPQLANVLKERLSEGPPTPSLRMSNLGERCERKLWYLVNTPDKGEELSGETRLKFLYGDILEPLLLYLAEQAGHSVELKQHEVLLHGVPGHIDAVIDGVLVDVKSASSWAFKKFKDHELEKNDPFGYLTQLNAYLHALQDNPILRVKGEAAFLAIDKSTGELCLDVYKKQDRNFQQEILRKSEVLSGDTEPSRYYQSVPEGVSGNARLGTECSYCAFKKHCWRDADQGRGVSTYLYSTGPKYFVRVIREPDVPKVA